MRQRLAWRLIGAFMIAFLCGAQTALSAEPQTIEQAIAQVKAITDPDPIKQNRRRAEEAMKIVTKRVEVINEWSWWNNQIQDKKGKDAFGDKLDAFRKTLENLSAEDARKKIAVWAWENKGGRCDEHAEVMAEILGRAGVPVRVLKMAGKVGALRTGNINHTFPVVGVVAEKIVEQKLEVFVFDNPWAWGSGAFVADSWSNKILEPEQAWISDWHFKNGEYSITLQIGLDLVPLVRSTLFQFVEKGLEVILIQCSLYRKVWELHMKMPEKYRKDVEKTIPAPDVVCGCRKQDQPHEIHQAALPGCENPPGSYPALVRISERTCRPNERQQSRSVEWRWSESIGADSRLGSPWKDGYGQYSSGTWSDGRSAQMRLQIGPVYNGTNDIEYRFYVHYVEPNTPWHIYRCRNPGEHGCKVEDCSPEFNPNYISFDIEW
jgi:hypothetical protein